MKQMWGATSESKVTPSLPAISFLPCTSSSGPWRVSWPPCSSCLSLAMDAEGTGCSPGGFWWRQRSEDFWAGGDLRDCWSDQKWEVTCPWSHGAEPRALSVPSPSTVIRVTVLLAFFLSWSGLHWLDPEQEVLRPNHQVSNWSLMTCPWSLGRVRADISGNATLRQGHSTGHTGAGSCGGLIFLLRLVEGRVKH